MNDKTNNSNSRFNDDNTFAPRVVSKGDGKNPLEEVDSDNEANENEENN